MKRFLCIMAALLSLFFFSSCGKDSPFDVSDIVGAWSLYRVRAVEGDEVIDSDEVPEGTMCFEFDDDGTGRLWWTDLQETGFSYTVSVSELIMDSAGSVIEVTIVTLTEDELSFSFVEDSAEMTYWFRRI